MHDINRNQLQYGAYHNLVKELQFDGEKFEQYFRLTKESKIPPNCAWGVRPLGGLGGNAIILLFFCDFAVFFGRPNGCFPKWINFTVGTICCHTVPPVGKSFMYNVPVFAAVKGLLH